MKLLVVSDLHYSLRQYDWLTSEASRFDLVIIAGDLMQLASTVDPDTQSEVVAQYFRRIAANAPLVVCSGNHDLVEDYTGHRSVEWLEELVIPQVVADCGCFDTDEVRILSLPWWNDDSEKERIGSWLDSHSRSDSEQLEIWVHHVPPRGTRVSWNGRRDAGSENLVQWIEQYQPGVVFSGHVHDAPYYGPEGNWIDQIGSTVVINGGRQIGDRPATVELEIKSGELIWCGMEGCQHQNLRSLAIHA